MVNPELICGIIFAILLVGISALIFSRRRRPKKFDYWEKKRIPFITPVSTISYEKPFNEILLERHLKLGPIYGYFETGKPKISIGEPSLLKNILIKDFSFFMNRKLIVTGDEAHDKMLTIARGEDWKRIRSIVSPMFTTGKLKKVFHIFKDCSEILVKNLKNAAEEGKSVDLKNVYGAFTTDVIAGAIFSAKVDSHDDPGNQFIKTAKDVFGGRPAKRTATPLLSRLGKLFKSNHASSSRTEIFRKITLQIIKERRKTGQVRNDFLQLLMDNVKDEKSDLTKIDENNINSSCDEQTAKDLSMDELVGQCLIFFLAGYETTSSTLTFVTHHLALHQDIQDKLREEVVRVLSETNGILTYEAVQNMKYLDNVISETLRLCPPAIQLDRYTNADYKLDETGITLPKGMEVSIPICALQRDPKFFSDPERFDPERFSTKQKGLSDPYSYMPFGAGPRNCVGMRFALLEIKVCLSYVIAIFRIRASSHNKEKMEFHSGASGFLRPTDASVNLEIRKDSLRII